MWYCVKNPFHWHSQIAFQLLLKVEIWTHFYKLHMIFQHWNRRRCVSTKKKYLRRKCSPSSLSFWSWSSSCISDSIEVKSVKFDNSKSAKSLATKKFVMSEKDTKSVCCFCVITFFNVKTSPSLHPKMSGPQRMQPWRIHGKSMRKSPPRG